jgi:hypothetical protein
LRGPHYALDLKSAQHFAFSDLAFFASALIRANSSGGQGIRAEVGNVDGGASLAVERAYLLAFLDRFLRGKHKQPLLAPNADSFAGFT